MKVKAVREISVIKQNRCHLTRSCSNKLSINSLNASGKFIYHLLYHEKSARSVFLCLISVLKFSLKCNNRLVYILGGEGYSL